MSSETIYMPYFYIIRHIPTGKKYAGIRYAKGCNPIEFMQPDGYQTFELDQMISCQMGSLKV